MSEIGFAEAPLDACCIAAVVSALANTLNEHFERARYTSVSEVRHLDYFGWQVSILRGLKERYEVHHGVRLQDASLVAAAQLSHRYIADRFLPDKAIDLVDEAAAKLNIEASLSYVFCGITSEEGMHHRVIAGCNLVLWKYWLAMPWAA